MNSLTTQIEEEHIQGRLIACHMDVDYLQTVDIDDHKESIKRDLAREIANFMVERNMIQFVQKQLLEEARIRISARVFVTPSDDVKTIRRIVVK